MIFIDQRYPVLDEDVQHVQERHVRCAVREAEELGSNETMDKDVISHLPQMLDCNRSREGGEPEIGSGRGGWEESYLVHSFQIEPRRRYQKISLSRRAYSERSNVAVGGGTRRRCRCTNSSTRATTSGAFVSWSRESMTAEPNIAFESRLREIG